MPYDAPPPSLLSRLSDELRSVVARVAPAIVSVGHRQGHGSGFALTPDGMIVTNHHVIAGARDPRDLRVGFVDGRQDPATLVGRDPATDLAILQVARSGLASLPLVAADQIAIGQIVLAIGNPLRFERSVSLGVVSAVDRALPASDGGMLEGLIQTDAAINPGNSGGPLVDVDGGVVGINTAMIAAAQGIGFAVPAQTASWVAAVLIRDGDVRRPWFGIAARGVDLPPGVLPPPRRRAIHVSTVVSGSPAARAGLRAEDLVLSANGVPTLLIDDLQRVCVLSRLASVELEVQRRGQRLALTVRLDAARPAKH